MSNAIDYFLEQISRLLESQSAILILAIALVLTFLLRVVIYKLFKLVLNLAIFALIYLLVLLGLSYWLT